MEKIRSKERFLSIFPQIPEQAAQILLPYIQMREVKKHTIYIAKGDIPYEFAFCSRGLFRYYYIDYQGNEYTKHFANEGNLIISYSAMIKQEEARFYIEALEDSTIGVISYAKYKECQEHSQILKDFEFHMVQKIYCLKEYRESQFLTKSPKERYLSFLKEHKEIANRVKQHQIASYIGVTPVTLSRLKNEESVIK